MRFVWFWTFWHWSKESFREGALLRSPLHGIGGHWDEWYLHEASESDRAAIKEAGRTESAQRQFIAWLFLHWARESMWPRNRLTPRFVLGQLAQLPPFNQWGTLREYRAGYGLGGVSAIVLGEGSEGEPEDIRMVEAIALPGEVGGSGAKVMSEGFYGDGPELETARRAALSLLRGKGLLIFLALWVAGGRRPYPRRLSTALALGWTGVAGLIAYFFAGPDPGGLLPFLAFALVALWAGLVLTELAVILYQAHRAWRSGTKWGTALEQGQVRLRMRGGLTLKGSSAGLPFCLNTLLSVYRVNPPAARSSWLWHRFFHELHCGAKAWAATGTIMPNASLKSVVLAPKFRACLQQGAIAHILTPRQRDGDGRVMNRVAEALTATRRQSVMAAAGRQVGFAAESPALRHHPCRHAAQALMAIGSLSRSWQMAWNVLAVVASGTMLLALPNLHSIIAPPPAPTPVTPSSPSPYYLWVSLDTKHPDCFQVVLDSKFWSNRRAEVKKYGGANASVRAEIRLQRLAHQATFDEQDGTVWIERRRRFLTREFAPGERVGRYSFSYLSHLGYE